ncbi:MAG: hypothetical protein IKU52_00165 [Clostridia bacterium]|nr:hypothetical protein [Clostridia bacterium]
MKKSIKAIFLFITVFALLPFVLSCKEKPDVKIKCFESNSVVITNNNTAVVIDASCSDLEDIQKFLESNNTEFISALIISCYTEDTLNAASSLSVSNDALNIYVPSQSFEGSAYNNFMDACDELSVEPCSVEGSVSFGAAELSVRVYAPLEDMSKSLITRIVCNKASMLFCSFADDERITEFVEYDTNNYDLIKLPVNSDDFDSVETLIDTAKPDIVIADPASKNNTALKRAEVYVSDKALSFKCNGKKISKE